jgi:LysR family nitrogen assimilation transcriptional regulator
MFTVKQLRYFVEISRQGSFTGAAQTLNVAQPALSYQIGQLEASLGAALFTRNARGVELTEAGTILVSHAEQALRVISDAATAVQDRGAAINGAVALGFLSSIAPFLAPAVVLECRRRFPQVVVTVVEGDNRSLAERLRTGTLDYAITLPTGGAGVDGPVIGERLFFYSRRGGPASGRQSISLAEALRNRLVLPPRTHMLRTLIESAAAADGLELTVEVEAGHLTSKSLVGAGIGCGIANFAAIKAEFETGLFDAAVLEPAVRRTLVLASARTERGDRAALEVRRVLVAAIEQLRDLLRWTSPEQ